MASRNDKKALQTVLHGRNDKKHPRSASAMFSSLFSLV